MFRRAVLALVLLACSTVARREVTEYEINLDLAPAERFKHIVPQFNVTVWKFWNDYFAKDAILQDALFALTDIRGAEVDELQQEIVGMAEATRLPLKFIQGIQGLYELQTLMVPIVNITSSDGRTIRAAPKQYPLPKGWEALARIAGPVDFGCTGIIATNKADGTVNHARNLDFSPVDIMTNLVYTGIFKKGGKEIFRSQMVAGYQSVITGMRFGPDGWAIERNTRYPDHVDGNEEMLKNLLDGRILNGWSLRKILEDQATYDGAVGAIEQVPYVSTEYAIVSGVKKGVIVAKDPESVAHLQILNQPGGNFEERDDYVIITNFDFFFHDIREEFDPTGGGPKPRRVLAQEFLNATAVLTPNVLFEAINYKGVIADTIFQAIMNVEKSVWNVSQPDL